MIGWLGCAGLTAAGGLAWSVRGRSATLLAPSVWRGDPDRQQVALTFDDGPSEATAEILDILHQTGAQASFFQCGANVERLPEAAAAVSRAGHTIGNHTWSHTRLDFIPRARMREEVGRAQHTLKQVHGHAPRWFRAPFGVRWFGLGAVQNEFGLTGAMWSCIARDWTLDSRSITARVLRNAGNGSIICLHDGRELTPAPDVRTTIAAVKIICAELQRRGMEMVTLDTMFPPDVEFRM